MTHKVNGNTTYLLMTDTPHNLLQKTTPGYTEPKKHETKILESTHFLKFYKVLDDFREV